MELNELRFPVYEIGTEAVIEEDDMLFIERINDKGESDVFIIDDRSVPGESLAMRRLIMGSREARLKPLSTAIFFIADLVKYSDPSKWFVDSDGKHFRYVKTTFYPLVCRKITKVKEIPTGGALIEVEGISSRFKTLHTPDPRNTHAGLILIGKGTVLYGLYPGPFQDTRRKV